MNLFNLSQFAAPARCVGVDGHALDFGCIEKVITKRLANRATHNFLSTGALGLANQSARYGKADGPEIYPDSAEYDGCLRRYERDVLGLTIFKARRKECELNRIKAFGRHFGIQRIQCIQNESEL